MDFNKTVLGIVSFLLFLLISTFVSANSFWIDNRYVQIQEWSEQDTILENDIMISNISLRLVVDKKILSTNANFSVRFFDASYNILEVHPKVCCNAIFINESQPYYQLVIKLNPSNLNWSKFYNYTFFNIDIVYKSKNYLKNDKIDKMIFINTNCIPKENCPKPDSFAIRKTVLLPNDIILRNYPKDTYFGRDVNELIFQDFTSTDKFQSYYSTKAIMYTDLKKDREDKLKWNLFNILLGALMALILGIIINMLVSRYYYKKTSNENKNLEDKLIAKINNIDKQIQNLKTAKSQKQKSKK